MMRMTNCMAGGVMRMTNGIWVGFLIVERFEMSMIDLLGAGRPSSAKDEDDEDD